MINLTYFLLLFLKLIEHTISTLRIIVINRGHKLFGAILNFIIAIIWSISTVLIVDKKDILSIIFFALGCFIGSYLGSVLEEKINYHLNK